MCVKSTQKIHIFKLNIYYITKYKEGLDVLHIVLIKLNLENGLYLYKMCDIESYPYNTLFDQIIYIWCCANDLRMELKAYKIQLEWINNKCTLNLFSLISLYIKMVIIYIGIFNNSFIMDFIVTMESLTELNM